MRRETLLVNMVVATQLFGAESIGEIRVEESLLQTLQQRGVLKDVIVKTEVITQEQIAKKQASTLSEAIDNEVGIQSATGCSMCGMKRVRINGLKGEYTTVLVDDVPMHSTVSSYYGLDALTTAGIANIEVARGSGASLIAPNAIGGVINIKSKQAEKNALFLDMAGGNEDYRLMSMVGTGVSDDKKTRATLAAQYSNQGQWDADGNGVNESPSVENKSLSVRLSHDFSNKDNIDVKLTKQKSSVFGGPMQSNHQKALQDSADASFVDDDVQKSYNGGLLGTLEMIDTEREELIARWTHEVNEEGNFVLTASGAHQIQDSVYEGDDYYSDDKTYYGDFRYNHVLNDEHFLTLGVDTKREKMRADSKALFEGESAIEKDDFDSSSYGLYLQDIWMPNDEVELSVALRGDKIRVDWTDQLAQKDEIDETILVPRLHLKWMHGESALTSRISAGQGYRAPLTFFESEHGILDDGFGIDIDTIERSNSAGYALSYDSDRLTSTISATWTQIENLAYINDSDYMRPTLTTLDKTLNTWAFDVVAGYQLTQALNLGASFEHFVFENAYKEAQFLAQIENRARFMLDYETPSWNINMTATWIGSRDLSEYGYEGWNRLVDVGEEALQKDTNAPSFYTVDAKVSKRVNKNFSLYMGVKNLFDYTQVKEGETPLFYDAEGGYDVGFIYGALRGRLLYAGLQAKF